jgi:hypothetical protein
MKKNKFALKFVILLILSLTLTAGYAQALPDLSSFGYRSAATPSVFNLISSPFSQIFGKLPVWNTPSTPDISSLNYITRDDAIAIAKGVWPGIILTEPARAQKRGGIWIVTLEGCTDCNCPPGYYCAGTVAGGTVKISGTTGEILSVSRYK